MLNKKVIHKTLGEGTIVKFENNITTVQFATKTLNFRYPDIFAQFLRFADEDLQKDAEASANESIAKKTEEERKKAEAKAAEIRRQYERMLAEENKKHKLSVAELKNKEHGNLAFKANFCNGGSSESCIGFKGVCSPEQIKYNIEKERRAWCSNPASPCGRYYRGEITYEELLAIHKESFVCYESRMLTEWRADAGEDLTSSGTGKARRIANAATNSLAVLTTELSKSSDRIIFGVFITGIVDEGDDISAGYVKADPNFTIELTLEEAKKMNFWNYYKNSDGSTRWSQRLYRYLSNDSCIKILEDIANLKSGAEKAHAEKVLARFLLLKGMLDKYTYNTESDPVHSKTYYSLESIKQDAEKVCAEKREKVFIWKMPSSQFKPGAFVFIHHERCGTFVYEDGNVSFVNK